jgi:thiol-disulfide isomerase/thioredoxin
MNTLLRKIMAWGSMGFAAAVLAFFTLPHYRQGESSIAGTKAENFSLDLDGKPSHLSDLHNKVVVLNFWATWCGPCLEETPSLIDLQKRIASRNGVVLGVSIDEDESAYEKFIRDQHINFPTYRDPSKKASSCAKSSAPRIGTPPNSSPISTPSSAKLSRIFSLHVSPCLVALSFEGQEGIFGLCPWRSALFLRMVLGLEVAPHACPEPRRRCCMWFLGFRTSNSVGAPTLVF